MFWSCVRTTQHAIGSTSGSCMFQFLRRMRQRINPNARAIPCPCPSVTCARYMRANKYATRNNVGCALIARYAFKGRLACCWLGHGFTYSIWHVNFGRCSIGGSPMYVFMRSGQCGLIGAGTKRTPLQLWHDGIQGANTLPHFGHTQPSFMIFLLVLFPPPTLSRVRRPRVFRSRAGINIRLQVNALPCECR